MPDADGLEELNPKMILEMHEKVKRERDEAKKVVEELLAALGQFRYAGGHYGLCIGRTDPRHKSCEIAEAAMKKAGRIT